MTGWNLPPGCSSQDIERAFGEESPCDVCGQWEDACVCPECPECSAYGDPYCYEHHGLVRTFEQTWLYAREEQKMIEHDRRQLSYNAQDTWFDQWEKWLPPNDPFPSQA